jgi:hypothetical protein
MFSFMATQAVALSRAKPVASEAAAPERADQRARKGMLSNVFDALVEARMRRAEIEIEHHRRFYEGHTR